MAGEARGGNEQMKDKKQKERSVSGVPDSSASTAIFENSPLGTLHFSFNDTNSFGSLDLSVLQQNGQIKRESPKDNKG